VEWAFGSLGRRIAFYLPRGDLLLKFHKRDTAAATGTGVSFEFLANKIGKWFLTGRGISQTFSK